MALAALKRMFSRESPLANGWLGEFKEDFKYTPDILKLEATKQDFVFEYGECMEGRFDHETFIDTGQVQKVGCAFTQFSNLVMYKKNLGSFSYPVILAHMPKHPPKQYRIRQEGLPGRIKGDLFLVQGAQSIVELDRARENGVAFKRVRMNVLFPYTKTVWNEKTGSFASEEHLEETPAWVYIGMKLYWDNLIDGGYSSQLVRRFKHVSNRREYAEHPMGDYYFYSALEDE